MTRHDYGSGTDPLNNPLHSGWAGSIAADLDGIDANIAGLVTTSLRDVSGIDPSSGQSLVWDEAQGVYVPRYAADAAGIVSLDYRFSVDLTVAQGEVATDNADPTLVTLLRINTLDANGVDTGQIIGLLAPPFWVGLTDQVNREAHLWRFDTTGPPVLADGVWDIPVVYREHTGGAFTEGQEVYVLARFIADPSLYVNVAGDTMTGELRLKPTNGYANLRLAADIQQGVFYERADGMPVFSIYSEPGADYLAIGRYDDDGGYQGSPLFIDGVTGDVSVEKDPTIPLGVATKQYVDNMVLIRNSGIHTKGSTTAIGTAGTFWPTNLGDAISAWGSILPAYTTDGYIVIRFAGWYRVSVAMTYGVPGDAVIVQGNTSVHYYAAGDTLHGYGYYGDGGRYICQLHSAAGVYASDGNIFGALQGAIAYCDTYVTLEFVTDVGTIQG